jgi:hypothetical protein
MGLGVVITRCRGEQKYAVVVCRVFVCVKAQGVDRGMHAGACVCRGGALGDGEV